MKNAIVSMMVVAGLAAAAGAGTVSMRLVERFGVGGEFNGQTLNGANPSAIAWNGTDLFVAGFASGGGTNTNNAGIVKYTATGGFVGGFGQIPGTPFDRGYSGLDISGNLLVAAYDSGAVHPQGITAWDLNGNALWAKSARGGSGVAVDPGFGGVDTGVAWTTFGSGRRALQDAGTGADIYTTANGMIITPDFGSSFWRDMDFRSNGDMVARRANDVTFLSRTGGNSGSASILVNNLANAAFVNGQNVAMVESAEFGDFVFYNDRATAAVNQSALNVLKAVSLSGDQLTLNLFGFGGTGFSLGNGYYDFSWDADTQTLAVLDFFNREVFIFEVPTPGALGVLAMGGLVAARRRR
jgi:hypothetical protein